MGSGFPQPTDTSSIVRRLSKLERSLESLAGQRRAAATTLSSGTFTVKGAPTSPAPVALMSTFAAFATTAETDETFTDPGGIRVIEGGDIQVKDGGGMAVNDGGGFVISGGGNLDVVGGGGVNIGDGGGLTIDGGSFSIGDKFVVDGTTGDITMTGRFQSGTGYPSTVIDQDFYGGTFSGILFQTTGPTFNVAGIKANVGPHAGYSPGALFLTSGQKSTAIDSTAERSEMVLSDDRLYLELSEETSNYAGYIQLSTRETDPYAMWLWTSGDAAIRAAELQIDAVGSPMTTNCSDLTMSSDTRIQLLATGGDSYLYMDATQSRLDAGDAHLSLNSAAGSDTWLYSAGHLNLRPADGYTVSIDPQPRPATGTMWQLIMGTDGALYYGDKTAAEVPMAKAWVDTDGKTITNGGSYQLIPFDTVDTTQGVTYSTATREFTVPETGLYLMTVKLHLLGGTVGMAAYIRVSVNGTGVDRHGPVAGAEAPIAGTNVYQLNAGDKVTFLGYQNSGAAVTISATTNRETSATIARIR